MPRVRKGSATRQSHKKVLKNARGRRGSASRNYRQAKEAVTSGLVYSRIGRKRKKRQFRAMWIVRLSAACRERGLNYSRLINGLKKANILLNRKMLSEIAIADAAAFDLIIDRVKQAMKI